MSLRFNFNDAHTQINVSKPAGREMCKIGTTSHTHPISAAKRSLRLEQRCSSLGTRRNWQKSRLTKKRKFASQRRVFFAARERNNAESTKLLDFHHFIFDEREFLRRNGPRESLAFRKLCADKTMRNSYINQPSTQTAP